MRSMNPYLLFNGQCRQAMEFYKECLIGELSLVPYAQMPGDGCKDFPKDTQEWIMHGILVTPSAVLMASDRHPQFGAVSAGNNFMVCINCQSVDEAEKLFQSLGRDGKIEMPIQETFFSPRFGMLTDRFGITWMINLDKKIFIEGGNPQSTPVTVEALVKAPVAKVWQYWSDPKHIVKWNAASDDWHTPRAESDLRTGGKFSARMEAKDGSFGFDFGGTYDSVKINEEIAYTLGDNRKVKVVFIDLGDRTKILETFEAEGENSVDMQKDGWQAILNNFKKYTEMN